MAAATIQLDAADVAKMRSGTKLPAAAEGRVVEDTAVDPRRTTEPEVPTGAGRAPLIAGVVGALLVLAVGAYFLFGRRGPEPVAEHPVPASNELKPVDPPAVTRVEPKPAAHVEPKAEPPAELRLEAPRPPAPKPEQKLSEAPEGKPTPHPEAKKPAPKKPSAKKSTEGASSPGLIDSL
jgi:hypothetical protein